MQAPMHALLTPIKEKMQQNKIPELSWIINSSIIEKKHFLSDN